MKHTGDSANIAFYQGDDGWWCEVLRSDFTWKKGKMTLMRRPVFHVTVYRLGVGEITDSHYRPRNPVAPGRLPDAAVTRLVRQALKGVQQ
jgi:hypothetical protein